MANNPVSTLLKNKFDLKNILSSFRPKLRGNDYLDIQSLRNKQWKQYKKQSLDLHKNLNKSVKENLGQKIKLIDLSVFGNNLNTSDIRNRILVPENTRLAEMSCVDEGTQSGEFIDEKNLNGDILGTISDPNTPRYILDIPGSGALNYECSKIESDKISTQELVQIENERLDKLARRIVHWCQKRNIFKFTVTYHCDCGAVHRRAINFPQLCNGSEIKVAEDCARTTAKKIRIKALELGYDLEVTTAFIGDKQMCKSRPSEMHNAIGTIGTLDCRVLGNKFDQLVHSNFFDVFIFSDFQNEKENPEIIKNIVSDAARNILLTINIAEGDHGWGKDHFSKQNPYLIILFASGNDQENEAKEVLNEINSKMDEEHKDKIDFFVIRTDL